MQKMTVTVMAKILTALISPWTRPWKFGCLYHSGSQCLPYIFGKPTSCTYWKIRLDVSKW